MHYVGGDSVFPFSLLEQSLHESGNLKPFRVVIASSRVLAADDTSGRDLEILGAAVRSSRLMLFFLYRPDSDEVRRLKSTGAEVIEIPDAAEFSRFAVRVADAIQAHNEYVQ
jgi:hypothetical protein